MMDIEKQFAELLTLTQLYVFQEHHLKDWTVAEPQAYTYFKNRAQTQKENKVSTVTPASSTAFSPPPVVASISPPSPPKKPPLLSAILEKVENNTSLTKDPENSSKHTRLEWNLEVLSAPTAPSFESLHTLYKTLFPTRSLAMQIPDDREAKKNKDLWKQLKSAPAVLILSFGEPDKQSLFLYNLAKAIEHIIPQPVEVRSALTIEALNEWKSLLQAQELRLIIATDSGIQSCPHLVPFYRETQKQSRHYLDRVPLILLSDLSLYLKEPKLKASLWQVLCEMLKS